MEKIAAIRINQKIKAFVKKTRKSLLSLNSDLNLIILAASHEIIKERVIAKITPRSRAGFLGKLNRPATILKNNILKKPINGIETRFNSQYPESRNFSDRSFP